MKMGVLNWTEGGFEIIGNLLTAEEFEDWLQYEGKQFLQDKLEKTKLKWLFGESRAKSKGYNEVSGVINKSESLKLAFKKSFDKLPEIVNAWIYEIKSRRIKLLIKNDFSKGVVAIPRILIYNNFQSSVVQSLSDSAELSRYEGLPKHFLLERATEAENSFFNNISNNEIFILPNNRTAIIGNDDVYDWHFKEMKGHYFCAYLESYNSDLSNRKQREKFESEISPMLKQVKTDLGYLTIAQLESIADSILSH